MKFSYERPHLQRQLSNRAFPA